MKETSIFTHTGIASRLGQRLKGYGERNQTPSYHVEDNVQSLQLLLELVAHFSIVCFRGQLKTEPHPDWSPREVQLYFLTIFPAKPRSLRPGSAVGGGGRGKEKKIFSDQRPSKRFERESGKGTKRQCMVAPPPPQSIARLVSLADLFQLFHCFFCLFPPITEPGPGYFPLA